MKVLIVCSYKEKLPEGCVPFIREQVAALHEQGCECEYFHVKGKGIVGYLKAVPKLRTKINEWKPDVVHAHYGLSCLVANLATRRVPVVSTYHGSDINVKSVLRFSKVAIRLSAWNIFVSQLNVEIAKPKKRWSLVPCGVELSEGQLMTREDARTALGWSAAEKKVLFAGAFDNGVKDPELAKAVIEYINKNIHKTNKNTENILLEDNQKSGDSVCCEQHDQSISADSVIVSELPLQNHPLSSDSVSVDTESSPYKKTSDSSSDCEKSEKKPCGVELIELKGYTREQVNTLMCGVDALLMTSKTEGSPQVIKEAMSCGCPIVSVDVGDVAERTSGVDGCYVVPSREPKDIGEVLKEAIAFMGKTKGRERILEAGLTNELVAKRIIEIYEGILGNEPLR